MPGWKKVKNYAAHVDLSERTTRDLLKQGLPHIRLSSGTILIEVEQADAWLRGFSVDSQTATIVDELMRGL
ncbi:hypothetical protein ACFL0S_03935 [Thermodesulfobacteriota bacterium]